MNSKIDLLSFIFFEGIGTKLRFLRRNIIDINIYLKTFIEWRENLQKSKTVVEYIYEDDMEIQA
jgi:hypothetical protein